MEINLRFIDYFLIIIFAIILSEIIQGIIRFIVNKYDYETYYILQNTFFFNLKTLYYGGITLINIVLAIAFFNKDNIFSMLPMVFVSILYFTPSIYKNLLAKFEYNKYNTSINYYCANKKSPYRRKVYDVMINELKEFDWNEIQNLNIKEIFLRDINSNWENIISFELFDEKLFQSTSNQTIGTLVYGNFTKNILSYIRTIEKLAINNLDGTVNIAFNSNFLLKFDNDSGFQYDKESLEKLIQLNNDSLRKQEDTLLIKNIYSEVSTIGQLSKNLQSIDNNEVINQFQLIIDYIKKFIEELNDNSIKTIIKLPDGVQHSKIFEKIRFSFTAQNIKLNQSEKNDIKHFIASRFKSNGNGYRVTQTDYANKNLFIENFDLIVNAFVRLNKDMKTKDNQLSKKELAQVLSEEFHELNLSKRSIENKL